MANVTPVAKSCPGFDHVVGDGDNLERISQRTGVPVQELLEINPHLAGKGTTGSKSITMFMNGNKARKADGSLIYPGDTVRIPNTMRFGECPFSTPREGEGIYKK